MRARWWQASVYAVLEDVALRQMLSNTYYSTGLAVAMSTAIFIGDLNTPLGVAAGVLYLLPVFIASRIPGLVPTLLIAGGCSGLVILGLHYSPPGADSGQVLMNRALALLVIGSAVFILTSRKQAELGRLLALKEELDA